MKTIFHLIFSDQSEISYLKVYHFSYLSSSNMQTISIYYALGEEMSQTLNN